MLGIYLSHAAWVTIAFFLLAMFKGMGRIEHVIAASVAKILEARGRVPIHLVFAASVVRRLKGKTFTFESGCQVQKFCPPFSPKGDQATLQDSVPVHPEPSDHGLFLQGLPGAVRGADQSVVMLDVNEFRSRLTAIENHLEHLVKHTNHEPDEAGFRNV